MSIWDLCSVINRTSTSSPQRPWEHLGGGAGRMYKLEEGMECCGMLMRLHIFLKIYRQLIEARERKCDSLASPFPEDLYAINNCCGGKRHFLYCYSHW